MLSIINDQIWESDKKILESTLGVYTYYILSIVIIGILAAWIIMSRGVQSNPGHKNTQIWSQPGFLNPRQPGRQPASFLAEFLNHPEAEGQPAEFLIS